MVQESIEFRAVEDKLLTSKGLTPKDAQVRVKRPREELRGTYKSELNVHRTHTKGRTSPSQKIKRRTQGTYKSEL